MNTRNSSRIFSSVGIPREKNIYLHLILLPGSLTFLSRRLTLKSFWEIGRPSPSEPSRPAGPEETLSRVNFLNKLVTLTPIPWPCSLVQRAGHALQNPIGEEEEKKKKKIIYLYIHREGCDNKTQKNNICMQHRKKNLS